VHADAERKLQAADPQGREMLISCGAALFNIRVTLRYLGHVPKVKILPEPDLRNLIARVSWSEEVPAANYEKRLYAEISRRYTHRGGFGPGSLPADLFLLLAQEAAKEAAALQVAATEDDRSALAAVVQAADYALRQDRERAQEQAHWAPAPGSTRRDGVPAAAYPGHEDRTQPYFPGRDFAHGRGWGLPPGADPAMTREAGVAALLVTREDDPASWVRAGQALQRVLLVTNSCGVATALHSQPLEIPAMRDFVRAHFTRGSYPQMVLRFGRSSGASVRVRRPLDEMLF
jgi:hypothetical protein